MEKELIKLGLTESEIKVYPILLELGSSASGAIIKKSGLQSSTVYHALDFLVRKGLVGYVMKNNRKYFEATAPSFLIQLIREKKKNLLEQEKDIRKILPELIGKQKKLENPTGAAIYEGYGGIKAAFNDILKTLKTGDEYCVFGARGGLPLKWTRTFFIQFNRQRIQKRIKKKIIFNEDVKNSTGKDEEKLSLTSVKYISQITPSAVNVYGNKVLIALWVDPPVAFLIENEEVAKSYRQYFDALWKIAKK
ncbi:MAG: helix-turn-helix domain-containing protein [Candidatus Nanoarchaeia archaeon]|nr:helix-turn-helix domain-containing protein [Candidatus Nanoarchaeia archaeon]